MSRLSRTWLGILWLGAARCTSATPSLSAEARSAGSEPSAATRCDKDWLDCCHDPALHVSLCRLFAELVDLRHLTRLPSAQYTSHMASSFDRASSGARPGDAAWLANRDYAQLTAGEPLVLLDTAGPGVVTRIWSANPSGTLRVYLDGAARPVIEADMRALLRGQVEPFGAPFGFEAAHGSNLYLPLPYQSHCKITVTGDARKLFYQVSYRRYQDAVQVEPFSVAALSPPGGMPSLVRARLAGADAPAQASSAFSLTATRTGAAHALAADGGGQLRELRVHVSQPTAAALRQTLLQIWVDGEETVRAPFGDFFGSGPGLQAVSALPVQVDPADGRFVARWPMPFRTQWRIALTQTDPQTPPLAADFELVHEPHTFAADQLLFYAQWTPPAWQASEPSHEYTLRALRGSGFYVGTLLNVVNTEASWWGEGDEHVWIDDEAFPSFFGTGTEDYFGYAWCSNELFSLPYIGQTRAGPHANFGRVSLYRFHLADPIRFTSQLRFDLEVNHWGDTPTPVAYDSLAYFYARPGAASTPAASELSAYRIPDLDVAPPDDVSAAPYRCGGSD
jgi:hypothetical protein